VAWTIIFLILLLLMLLVIGPGWWGENSEPPQKEPVTAIRIGTDTGLFGAAPQKAPEAIDRETDLEAEKILAAQIEEPGKQQQRSALPNKAAKLSEHGGEDEQRAILSEAQRLLQVGDHQRARDFFRALTADTEAAPLTRFLALTGAAQSTYALEESNQAILLLTQALNMSEGIPQTWMAATQELNRAMVRHENAEVTQAILHDAFLVEHTRTIKVPELDAKASSQNTKSTAPLSLEINTTDYTLSIMEDGKVREIFPVGLGKNGATPLGTFRIANKISHPDWYNRGDVVKAGDPANPLGSRWMGLGDESGPSPIGIHATKDAASIGDNQSLGCIRMRPEDAERLFDSVSEGTLVKVY
jgi:lipoprotein-anchoring transpeptidase ErfK/SrfK